MHRQCAHDDEAAGLAGREHIVVRLQLSPLDRIAAVLRWTLGLAGAVVVLWVGAAFLSASPASAAVVLPVAAQQSLLKGGNSRLAAAGGDEQQDEQQNEQQSEEPNSSESGESGQGQGGEPDESGASESESASDDVESGTDSDESDGESESERGENSNATGEVQDSSESADEDADDEQQPTIVTTSAEDESSETQSAVETAAGSAESSATDETAQRDTENESEPTSQRRRYTVDVNDVDVEGADQQRDDAAETAEVQPTGLIEQSDAEASESSEPDDAASRTDRRDGRRNQEPERSEHRVRTGTEPGAADAESAELEQVEQVATQLVERVEQTQENTGENSETARPTRQRYENSDSEEHWSEHVAEVREAITEGGDITDAVASVVDEVAHRVEQARGSTRESSRAGVRPERQPDRELEEQDPDSEPSWSELVAEAQEAIADAEDVADAATSVADEVVDEIEQAREPASPDEARDGEASWSERVAQVREAVEAGDDVADAVSSVVDEIGQDVLDRIASSAGREALSQVTREVREHLDDANASGGHEAGVATPVNDLAGAEPDAGSATAVAHTLRTRGPPMQQRSLDDEEYEEYEDSDEEELTERVLTGTVEVDASAERLARERREVAAGNVTAAEHAQHQAEHQELAETVEADRAELSPERVELVDEVVNGHREIEQREQQLAAQERQVAAGTIDAAVYERHAGQLEADRQELYEATDELREATGNDPPQTVPAGGPDEEGAEAGCGTSGVFVECGAVTQNANGERDEDHCLALAGVSSGCGVQAGSGDSESAASCDLGGSGQTCQSSTTSGGSTSSASCEATTGDCEQGSTAGPDGAEVSCETDAGTCRADAMGGAAQLAASCTGSCELLGTAGRDGANVDCSTDAGRCDSRSSGTSTSENGRLVGSASARCQTTSGGCGTAQEVVVEDSGAVETVVDTECQDGAAGCRGDASTQSDATGGTPGGQAEGSSSCTTEGGGCSARSGSGAEGEPEPTSGVAVGYSAGSAGTSWADAETGCAEAATGCTGTARIATRVIMARPSVVTAPAQSRETSAAANCVASGGECRIEGSSDAATGMASSGSSDASLAAGCSDGPSACTTRGSVATGSAATGAAPRNGWTNASASCEAGGVCDATTSSQLDTTGIGDAEGASAADAGANCADAPACTGNVSMTTSGSVTAAAPAGQPAATRTTSGSARCNTSTGACGASTASQVSDQAADLTESVSTIPARTLAASSAASAQAECAVEGCAGGASTTTTGAAAGDVPGVRDSTGSSSCTVHGAGGGCTTAADTAVEDRDPTDTNPADGVMAVSGPVSVSNASAQVQCTGGEGTCGGSTTAETIARDTAVAPHARGTRATADCAVTGGGCAGEAGSSASSAPDFVAVDPATGRPIPGQPTSGPTSVASSSASLQCPDAHCSGTATTSTAAWDGAVAGGAPRTSTGTAECAGGTGGCAAQSVSHASTGSGAALALAPQTRTSQTGQEQETGAGINAARLVAGPSAASATGAALTCEGEPACDGTASSAATATDPAVSPDPRGSWSEGACESVTGGVCQAVTNSAASTGPDANIIAPLVTARSTANATVTEGTTGPAEEGSGQQDGQQQGQPGHDQPAVPPAPTAPGSSANTGGPAVPGASSWTMASATLDCSGASAGCVGTTRTSAEGSDGPSAMNGANGARGPPTGGSSTSASCVTGQAACQAQTSTTAGSGQVVADIIAEQQNTTAAQLAAEAEQAEQEAAETARIAGQAGATEEQKTAAADSAQAAQQARQTATEAAELAAQPVENPPAGLVQSTATAECSGPECTATTTAESTTTSQGDAAIGVSRTEGRCTGTTAGCATGVDASAATTVDNAQNAAQQPVAETSGVIESTATITCLQGCTGGVTGSSYSAASPDGGARVAIGAAEAARAGEDAGRRTTNGAASDPTSISVAHGETGCTGQGACQAGITMGGGAAASNIPGAWFGSSSASAEGGCLTASGACIVSTSSRTAGTDDPSTLAESVRTGAANQLPATTRAVSSANCAGVGGCRVSTGGFVFDQTAEVTAGCVGVGCTTGAEGNAVHGASRATSSTACSAGAGSWCTGSVRVGATPTGAEAAAFCMGGDGATCAYSYRARSAASASSSGSSARAAAEGYGAGTFGGGHVIVAAAAEAAPGTAQASASCLGSPGTNCSHTFEATASASARDPNSGSHAEAYAHGSGAGGMGGGSVVVSAQAFAQGNHANASAACTGAMNCTATYSAFAQDSDHVETEFGEWDATHWASCSGSGNGGCGVTAVAVAGPEGGDQGGYATCTGNCANFNEGGSNVFTPYAPPDLPPGYVLNSEGEPVPIEELGPEESGATLSRNDSGGYDWWIKPRGGEVEHGSCSTDCPEFVEASAGTGERVEYHPESDTPFHAYVPVGPDSDDFDHAWGENGAQVTRDAEGDGGGYVDGLGGVTNGETGETTQYTRVDPDQPRNTFRLTNPNSGSPFQSSCNGGCIYIGADLPGPRGRDVLVVEQGIGEIIGRDAHGNPARIWFDGIGRFTSAEGDMVTSCYGCPEVFQPTGMAEGRVDIVTRDQAGFGGSISIDGSGDVVTREGVTLICGGCIGTHYMPTASGLGGVNVCSVANGGTCVGNGPGAPGARDTQNAYSNGNGSAEFVQFMRNADGSGGGAIAFTSGAGSAEGADMFGNWIRIRGDGGRMALLYATADGYNSGQACAGECSGSDPVERRLAWVEPTEDVLRALNPNLGPGVAGPVSVGLLDRGRAAFRIVEAQAQLRWRAEVGNDEIAPVAMAIGAAFDRAVEDGAVTPSELHELAQLVATADPAALERAGRTGDAVQTLALVNSTRAPSLEDIESRLAEDPQLVAELLLANDPNYNVPTDPDWEPSAEEIDIARAELLEQQGILLDALQDLDGMAPHHDGLQQEIDAWEQSVTNYYLGLGGDLAEIRTDGEELQEAINQLAADEQPIRDRLDQALGVLRSYDLLAAAAAGDPAYVQNMEVALENIEAIEGVLAALPMPETEQQASDYQTIAEFADIVRLGYEASISAPRLPDSRLHDLELPSTGSPDLALAMRGATGRDFFNDLANQPSSPFAELNADELANLAATWVYRDPVNGDPTSLMEVAALASTPRTAAIGVEMMAGRYGDPGYEEAMDAYFRQINQAGLIDALGADMPEEERELLRQVVNRRDPRNIVGFFEFMYEGAAVLNSEVVRTYNGWFGDSRDALLRNVGRGAASLFFGAISSVGAAVGAAGVEFANAVRYGHPLAHGGAAAVVNAMAHDPPRAGESGLDYYSRLNPLTGGMVAAPLMDTGRRMLDGNRWGMYHDNPELAVQDVFTLAMVAAPVAVLLRAGAASAAARASIARGARMSHPLPGQAQRAVLLAQQARFTRQAHRYDTAATIVSGIANAAWAPSYLAGAPVRLAAWGARVGTTRLARAAHSHGMERTAGALGHAAESFGMIASNGFFGTGSVGAAYRDLGVRRSASDWAITNAHRVRMAEVNLIGEVGDPYRTARRNGLDRSLQIVLNHRAMARSWTEGRSAAPNRVSWPLPTKVTGPSLPMPPPGWQPPRTMSRAPATSDHPVGAALDTTCGRCVTGRIDAALMADSSARMTIAELARQLGIKKRALRAALAREAERGYHVGAGGPPFDVVVDSNGTAWVQRLDLYAENTGGTATEHTAPQAQGYVETSPNGRGTDAASPAGAAADGELQPTRPGGPDEHTTPPVRGPTTQPHHVGQASVSDGAQRAPTVSAPAGRPATATLISGGIVSGSRGGRKGPQAGGAEPAAGGEPPRPRTPEHHPEPTRRAEQPPPDPTNGTSWDLPPPWLDGAETRAGRMGTAENDGGGAGSRESATHAAGGEPARGADADAEVVVTKTVVVVDGEPVHITVTEAIVDVDGVSVRLEFTPDIDPRSAEAHAARIENRIEELKRRIDELEAQQLSWARATSDLEEQAHAPEAELLDLRASLADQIARGDTPGYLQGQVESALGQRGLLGRGISAVARSEAQTQAEGEGSIRFAAALAPSPAPSSPEGRSARRPAGVVASRLLELITTAVLILSTSPNVAHAPPAHAHALGVPYLLADAATSSTTPHVGSGAAGADGPVARQATRGEPVSSGSDTALPTDLPHTAWRAANVEITADISGAPEHATVSAEAAQRPGAGSVEYTHARLELVAWPQDTPRSLAEGLGTTVERFRAVNAARGLPVGDDDIVGDGTRWAIPAASRFALTHTYVVQPGVNDSLSAIAVRFEVPGGWRAVAEANTELLAGRDPNSIYPGEKFQVPDVAPVEPPSREPDPGDVPGDPGDIAGDATGESPSPGTAPSAVPEWRVPWDWFLLVGAAGAVLLVVQLLRSWQMPVRVLRDAVRHSNAERNGLLQTTSDPGDRQRVEQEHQARVFAAADAAARAGVRLGKIRRLTGLTREQVAALRPEARVEGENRFYPTGTQEVLGLLGLGSFIYQLLHLKPRLKKTAEKWREWITGLVYNRAYTAGPQTNLGSEHIEIPLPGQLGELLFLRLTFSADNLGYVTALDNQELKLSTVKNEKHNHVVGIFPAMRWGAQVVLSPSGAGELPAQRDGLVRVEFALVVFSVPGKKFTREFTPPRMHGLHLMARIRNWFLSHDSSVFTWRLFEFITQTHLVVGVGPADAASPNYSEYRFSVQGITYRRSDGKEIPIQFIPGPARSLGRVVRAVIDWTLWGLRQRLAFMPRSVRQAVWWLVDRLTPATSLAERRDWARARVLRRGQRLLLSAIAAPQRRLDQIARELPIIEAELADPSLPAVVGEWLHRRLVALRREQHKLQYQLDDEFMEENRKRLRTVTANLTKIVLSMVQRRSGTTVPNVPE